MTIKLKEIFIAPSDKQHYKKEELLGLKLRSSFINEMATKLNLIYLEKSQDKGNLCYLNDKNIRPEFRTSFGKRDIVNLIKNEFQRDHFDLNSDEIHFPDNSAHFWELINKDEQ